MGLVLLVSSCTSVYKQAPETTLFNGRLVVYAFGLVLLVVSCTSIQIGTKTKLLNGGLVAYTHGLGV